MAGSNWMPPNRSPPTPGLSPGCGSWPLVRRTLSGCSGRRPMTDDSSSADLARRTPATGDAAGCVTGRQPKRTVSVRDPAQLINLVPYQLGFQPADGDIVVL